MVKKNRGNEAAPVAIIMSRAQLNPELVLIRTCPRLMKKKKKKNMF